MEPNLLQCFLEVGRANTGAQYGSHGYSYRWIKTHRHQSISSGGLMVYGIEKVVYTEAKVIKSNG